MSRGWTYKPGTNQLICDRCSAKIKASESRRTWEGFQVCHGCYEERHPQDFVRAKQDKISVPVVRPIPPLVFTTVTYADTDNTTIPPGNNNGEL